MMIDRVKQVIADTFVLEVAEIPDDLAFGQIEEWDSMGHIQLISALESNFGVSFTLPETEQLGSVTSIADCIKPKIPRA